MLSYILQKMLDLLSAIKIYSARKSLID